MTPIVLEHVVFPAKPLGTVWEKALKILETLMNDLMTCKARPGWETLITTRKLANMMLRCTLWLNDHGIGVKRPVCSRIWYKLVCRMTAIIVTVMWEVVVGSVVCQLTPFTIMRIFRWSQMLLFYY